MINFEYTCPTRVIFGKGTQACTGKEVKKYGNKVLVHYGGSSAKRSGLYNQVIESLRNEGLDFIELGNVKPNPHVGLVREGIRLCREESVNFILAVGGGSVIDSAKAIAAGSKYHGDVWDFYIQKAQVEEALPLGVVLTIPAAGSEISPDSVITNNEGLLKRGCSGESLRPKFSILNPELCYTLPEYQISAGITDILAHVMERYFTNTPNTDLTDRLCEATMKSIMVNAPKVLQNKTNYDAWAEIMWGGSIAHCNLLGTGRQQDWGSHNIEHELSAQYDIAHGAGLAIIFPAWMKYVYHNNLSRFVQFAVRVLDVDLPCSPLEDIALEGIRRIEQFFHSIKMPVRLGEVGISEENFELMAKKACQFGTIGNLKQLQEKDVLAIYHLAK